MTAYEIFTRQYTKIDKQGQRVPNYDFRQRFGEISIDAAWEIEQKRLEDLRKKLEREHILHDFFRNEVKEGRARLQRSRVSESEYYHWYGHEFRFSAHRYPTGSMTNELLGIIDMTDEGATERVIKQFNIILQ